VLAEGFTKKNAIGVLIAALFVIPLVSFTNLIQPFLLREVFNIPASEQGSLTGLLGLVHELTIILLVGFIGALSDNFGRRIIIMVGLGILAAGFFIYPLAQSKEEIIIFRVVIGIGAAALTAMQTGIINDAPEEGSRGKFLGMVSFLTGVGIATLAVQVSKLPTFYIDLFGVTEAIALRYVMWSIVGLLFLVGLMLFFTIKPGRVAASSDKEPVLIRMQKGLSEALTNPKIALSYIVSFASRGDIVVVGTYMSLWVSVAAVSNGIDSAEGFKRAGMIVAAIQGTALVWAMCLGIMLDRLNRLLALCFAFGTATAAYFVMGQMSDPFDNRIFFACIFLGIGEISTVLTGTALIGQEAPIENRGAVMGMFTLFGGIGILVATFFGGKLFDAIGPSTPFTMMAFINAFVFVAAVFTYIKTK